MRLTADAIGTASPDARRARVIEAAVVNALGDDLALGENVRGRTPFAERDAERRVA